MILLLLIPHFFFFLKKSIHIYIYIYIKKKINKQKIIFKCYLNNYVFFIELFNSIFFAKKFIYIQFYYIKYDIIGIKFINILKFKSYECNVYIIINNIFNIKKNKINLKNFNNKLISFNYRSHKKFILIDNKITWFGGYNIGEEYVNFNNFYNWSDLFFKFFNFSKINILNDFFINFYMLPIFNIKKNNFKKEIFFLKIYI